MRYGHFDNEKREYVIDRVDLPVSWTNYIGVEDLCAVMNHTAGGYMFYRTPQYHRITRFRPNGVPIDRPGHYVYLRDDEDGDYWSISWQPVGKSLEEASYICRHGMSYSVYECGYKEIEASQRLVIPLGEAVELWDVRVKNTSQRVRRLSVYGYCEFSFHHIDMDNQNFQMSLYASGSSYKDGVIEYDLFYEEFGYQYFTATFMPDGYDCVRDRFIGNYRTETNPMAVERGCCFSSEEKGGNHCGALHKRLTLAPGEEVRLVFLLGEGRRKDAERVRGKYSRLEHVDQAAQKLAAYWEDKFAKLQVCTPNEAMNTMLNTWNLYQAEVNILFSRFASFIEVGGRTGLGYRDTAQDAMTIPHSNPQKCRQRIEQLLHGLVSKGYGLHLFDPAWFEEETKARPFASPTVIPVPDEKSRIHGLEDTCSDDALWLIPAIMEYVRETGDEGFLDREIGYADGGSGSVYEHMKRILDFSAEQVGSHGICKGLRADWNDCLNLGGGESALVSFLHVWALDHFLEAARRRNEAADVKKYEEMYRRTKAVCGTQLWDGDWFIRGFTKSGRKIGTHTDREGRIHLESNAWAVLSGAATYEQGIRAMDSVDQYLYTPYGIMLNGPSYTIPDDKFANLKAGYSFMIGHPGKKLLFMGQDFAQFQEWSEDRELDWYLLGEEKHQQMQSYVRALLKLYGKTAALYDADCEPNGFEWINADDNFRSIYSFVRHSENGKNNLLFVINFTPVARPDYRVGVPRRKQYKLILNSDAAEFGGSGKEQPEVYKAVKQECDGRPYSFAYDLPAYGVAIFKF